MALEKDGVVFNYIADGNKNITQLINLTTGEIDNKYDYSPFGQLAKTDENVENVFKFSSEYYEKESGLVYYNYRYYNPSTGKWINRDPIQEYGGLNTYGFVNNNSISYIDWLGLSLDIPHMTIPDGGGGSGDDIDDKKKECNKNECSQELIDQCNKAYEKIKKNANNLRNEWEKYDPVKDATGGYKGKGVKLTVPGGHYIEMINNINGINKALKTISKCLRCKNFPDHKKKLPKWIRDLASKPIPKPKGVEGLPEQPEVEPDPVRPNYPKPSPAPESTPVPPVVPVPIGGRLGGRVPRHSNFGIVPGGLGGGPCLLPGSGGGPINRRRKY
ncbi:RHS repeat-associated core domain-containing protein [Lentisphaerota bacterium WC36G]|nr:RHS repeat-associated core domain-containing protein [Lentisphaerae bacterium WC36]